MLPPLGKGYMISEKFLHSLKASETGYGMNTYLINLPSFPFEPGGSYKVTNTSASSPMLHTTFFMLM
jgi:hypothetical protein